MKKLVCLALALAMLLSCAFAVSAETEGEIVDAAFALDTGAALDGTYTLTGEVKSVVTPYNSQYENVTVNLIVKNSQGEEKIIQAFRIKGADAATVAAGDVITVTGKIKNYNGTIEFDAGSTFVTVSKGETQKQPETEEEILSAAFALENNTALVGTYSLTGVVTDIPTEFSSDYNNITVNFKVADKTVMCYRLVAESADDVIVGDKITVTGSIKNYRGTVEFDAGCTFVMVEQAPRGGDVSEAVSEAVSEEASEAVSEEISEEVSEAPALTTEPEIVDAAFGLDTGKALDGTYSLTGEVTAVVTPYSGQFENVTVNITVKDGKGEDRTIQCFRIKGEDAATVGAGDVITVTGVIKNYGGTVEFDSGSTFVTVSKGEAPKQLETEEEILAAAFELEDGESLGANYSLTGTVKEKIAENNQIVITVGDKDILCYRLNSENFAAVGVGDVVTVTGNIKNYKGTVEFAAGCTSEIVKAAEHTGETSEPADESEEEVSAPSAPTTESEILAAAFALGKDEALDGTYSLTGEVTKIVTEYNDQYKNVTVNIKVGGKTVQCFRIKGDDAATVGVGDKITVTGKIKNYNGTVEFDSGSTFVTVNKASAGEQEESKPSSAKTGDVGVIAIAIVGALALAGAVVIKRRK